MAINLANADVALKTYYLEAITEQLDKISPFYAMIKKNADNVYGKEIKKLITFGLNGGVGAGSEEGSLPKATGNSYLSLTATLKNLYGSIEITDKAIRASESSTGAFINLLNAEMQGLLKSSEYNFERMLFGDGTGLLANITDIMGEDIIVDSTKNFTTGMQIDLRDNTTHEIISGLNNLRVVAIDESIGAITLDKTITGAVANQTEVTVSGAYNNEISGLGAIFNGSEELYGIKDSSWRTPYILEETGEITELKIQQAIDYAEEKGEAPNIILCSYGVRRALQKLFSDSKRNIDTFSLAGGYRAISYNGIPIVAERFCPKGQMYLLNTNNFSLEQLCDWQWIEGENGKILHQINGKAVYSATLVKYAELICDKPYAQALLKDIQEL